MDSPGTSSVAWVEGAEHKVMPGSFQGKEGLDTQDLCLDRRV